MKIVACCSVEKAKNGCYGEEKVAIVSKCMNMSSRMLKRGKVEGKRGREDEMEV